VLTDAGGVGVFKRDTSAFNADSRKSSVHLHGWGAHEDASWRFSVFAVSRRKLLHQIPATRSQIDRTTDVAIVRREVNATNRNKQK
jgi:hypothetical protein